MHTISKKGALMNFIVLDTFNHATIVFMLTLHKD